MSSIQQTLAQHGNEAKRLIRPLLAIVAFAWLIEVIDRLLFAGGLDHLGILPRQLIGLRGLFFAPFLHGNFGHLLANSIPFIILGFAIMLRHGRHFLGISLIIALISGLGTWLIAPAHTVHIGASGLIFGYLSFIVVNAWYERSFTAVAVAAFVIFLYGGLIWGVLPAANGVSWQGHFFGLIGGVVAAYYYSSRHSAS